MSYNALKANELEKGLKEAARDVLVGAGLAATVAASHGAHLERKGQSFNQMKEADRAPASQIEQVIEAPAVEQTDAKIKKWRDKLNAVRARKGEIGK